MVSATNITVAGGATTITSSSPNWTSADVGKVIRIERPPINNPVGTFINVFNGIIQGFNSPTSINIAGVWGDGEGSFVSESFDRAEWATNDDACITAINTFINATAPRNFNIIVLGAVAFTQPIVWNNVSGTLLCSGADGLTTAGNPDSGFIWFGTTPDQVGMTIQNSAQFHINNCQLIGATSVPLLWGFQFYNPSGGTQANRMNTIENSTVNSLVGAVRDAGNGMVSGTLSADATAHSGQLLSTSTPTGLRPGQVIELIDQTGGPELVVVSASYTPDSLTIPLVSAQAPYFAHLAANTTFTYGWNGVKYAYGWPSLGTQDDRNKFINDAARDVDVGFADFQSQAAASAITNGDVEDAAVGVIVENGNVLINNLQLGGVCWRYFLTKGGTVVTINPGEQLGTNDACGPGLLGAGFTSQLIGLDEHLIFGNGSLVTTATTGGGVFHEISGNVNFGRNSTSSGSGMDFVDSGSAGSNPVVIMQDERMIPNQASGAAPTAGLMPTIHTHNPGTGNRDYDISYEINLSAWHLNVIDAGTASGNQVWRRYKLRRKVFQNNTDVPEALDLTLRGAESWSDITNWFTQYGNSTFSGLVNVTKLDVAAGPILYTCQGGGSGFEYYYKVAWSINGVFQAASPATKSAQCAGTIGGANTMTMTVRPVRGADTATFYRSSACADPCGGGDPGDEAKVGTAAMRFNGGGTSAGALSYVDTSAAAPSGAPPTVDSTGQLTVSGALNLGAVTVAALPTVCTAGDTRGVRDWNGTNGACTGGSTNYVTATCGASNNWFCP